MTTSEMSRDELLAHGVAIAASETKEDFVSAFVAYARDVVERETDPYEKIALFVHGMIEGHCVMSAEFAARRRGAP